jgi:heme oxygenase
MTQGKNSPSLRNMLRQLTRDAHDRVDTLYGACDLAREADYRRFLTAQAAAWVSLPSDMDPGSAARRAAILQDLAALGVAAPPSLNAGNLPASDALGLRYVLEGSRLGSTVLLRDLRAAAPGLADVAGGYLAVSADLEGWRHLSTILQLCPRNDVSDAAIVADARCIFDLFEQSWWATEAREVRIWF